LVAVLAPWLAPYDPASTDFPPLEKPSWAHPFGTTSYGQDILSQAMWGARPSLMIAVVAGLATTLIALVIGVTAAYAGGLIDRSLSLTTDVFLVLPALPLMIVITAYLPNRGTWLLITVIVITGWAWGARQLRAQGLSVRRREYVEAARARGERGSYIVSCEIVPTMVPLITASFLGAAFYAVLAAAGLQFLGLGDVTSISWGSMLYWAQNNEALTTGAIWWAIVPGACIGLLGAAFTFLNYGIDELANPVLRSTRRRRGRR
jgi:peptide/nickel transport system permease protein